LAATEADRLGVRAGGEVRLDSDALARLPEALGPRVILRALETLDPSRAYGWEEADGVLASPPAGGRGSAGLAWNENPAKLS
jgi:hypothetical protein